MRVFAFQALPFSSSQMQVHSCLAGGEMPQASRRGKLWVTHSLVRPERGPAPQPHLVLAQEGYLEASAIPRHLNSSCFLATQFNPRLAECKIDLRLRESCRPRELCSMNHRQSGDSLDPQAVTARRQRVRGRSGSQKPPFSQWSCGGWGEGGMMKELSF